MANGTREFSKHHEGHKSVGELATRRPDFYGSRATSECSVLRQLSGHHVWASARNKYPKPKELVCDGGKVGVMPKEPMLVPPLWEESVNVKTCLGINTPSNRNRSRSMSECHTHQVKVVSITRLSVAMQTTMPAGLKLRC